MHIGMLWLDDDAKRPLVEKIEGAVAYYQHKYGRMPELCLVNPALVPQKTEVGSVEVAPLRTILPHYFWLGMRSTN